jgi:hypothetical protein
MTVYVIPHSQKTSHDHALVQYEKSPRLTVDSPGRPGMRSFRLTRTTIQNGKGPLLDCALPYEFVK